MFVCVCVCVYVSPKGSIKKYAHFRTSQVKPSWCWNRHSDVNKRARSRNHSLPVFVFLIWVWPKKDPFFLVRKKPFPEKHFGGIKTLMLPNQTLTVSYCVRVQVATIQPQSQNNLIVDTTVYFISFFWIFSLINLTKKKQQNQHKKTEIVFEIKIFVFLWFCLFINTN